MVGYICIAIFDIILPSAECYDQRRMCLTLKDKPWFNRYCSGSNKHNTLDLVGGTTLSEACKHSCALCPGNIEYIDMYRSIYISFYVPKHICKNINTL